MDDRHIPSQHDGNAYRLAAPFFNAYLTQVGRGTPGGEYMRRFWHPVAVSAETGATPKSVRVLGEDLIVFRDGKGRPGLVYPRCCHRGADLYYGKIEDEGIRCCYHGWLFDVEGRCLDQPCEPEGGLHKERVRQPWYPVREQYGLVWAYMGPPEKMPLLPRYDVFETRGPGEIIVAEDNGLGSGGDAPGFIAPCNWLQHWENIMDPFHVPILHASFSVSQFVKEMAILPEGDWEYVPLGVRYTGIRQLGGGRALRRVTEVMAPTLRVVASPLLKPGFIDSLGWTLPVDDTHYKIFSVHRTGNPGERRGSLYNGKRWSELTPEEHQAMPGDYEAQVGQGPVTFHSEEHLTTTDKGIGMLRRFLARQIKIVEDGGDPAGVIFDEAQIVVKLEAGNFFFDEAAR